ncbi:uncharacterized protein LOC111036467 [Myzus persicae]|uniref:uncharacterized protein LOC111036467 n=1 Tax=Myzus persicae TaxID=13164 RepID=UPI000B93732C|nr:uncharacterized protein LOC111036467 [Myzus persicae]XP_022174185.1 uncharacterized protein LOC111036467 [Myzus persicae]
MEKTVLEGGASKRPLDDDDDGDKKKFKTGSDLQQFLPTIENIKNVNDAKKWSLLPSIVYELLALFKKSEKVNSNDDKQDKIDNDYKEDFKVLSNQSCQEKCLDNAFNHEHLKEIDRCDKIIEHSNSQDSSNTKDFVQNLNKLDSSEKRTEDVAKKVPLITKASPVKLFAENTDVDKTKQQAEDESNGKISVVKKQLTSIHDVCHLSAIHCTDLSTNDISKAPVLTKNDSNTAASANSIYNTPMHTSDISIPNTPILISTNSVSSTAKLSSTNHNTLIVSERSAHKNVISRTENSLRVQMFEFLNKNCQNSISGVPLTKPSPCTCNCCTVVNSLPTNQSAVYNLFFTSSNNLSYMNLQCDINSSNVPVADNSISATNYSNVDKSKKLYKLKKPLINTDSPKNIWINELTSLISKKENISKICLTTTTSDSKKLNPIKNVMKQVHKTTQHIKSHFSFCSKCKKSKYSRSDSCKCYNRSYKDRYDTY